jgi:hypothetical protein
MKGSKDKEKIERLQRRSRAPNAQGAWEEDQKHQACMENMQRGLRTLSTCQEHTTRIDIT